ncbi:hypothetical protein [Acetivibrio cellulolyticus]|uniref:hypothetical protein n=1 Tax=Acetivibrio cellulolyticus TaxID=35830 RepID=UPI0001E304B4|nr:hypothetical protein [Acetivibrio cellulolyticus]
MTINDFPMYRNRMLGYIKLNSLCENDFIKLAAAFENLDLSNSSLSDKELLTWLYFRTDLYMLEYYYNKYKRKKQMQKNTNLYGTTMKSENTDYYKIKYVDLFCKIVDQYELYYQRMVFECYKSEYVFLKNMEDEYLLYDVMTLNREIILYDFLFLNTINGNPYEKLVFCYKSFIEGWNSKLILTKLRKMTLNNIFIKFINEYSKQAGLPQMAVLFYFYPLEESLNSSNKELSKLNKYFTPIDITKFLSMDKIEKSEFIKNTIVKRVNLIDRWCTKIRERIINENVELMVSK